MAISRMQQPRQQYGLGKLVKKAFKGIKKIAKSPLGKAALVGGGLWGINKFGMPGIGGKNFLSGLSGSTGGIGGFAKKWLNPFNTANPLLYNKAGQFSGKKAFGLGAGALIAAPFIQSALKMGPYEDEEEGEAEDWSVMPSSLANITNRAQNYYRQPTSYSDFQFMPEKQFVNPNFYAADGGRAGLLNGGEAGEAQMEQMLRAEYLKYRNKGGTMPYEQFKILVMKQSQQGQMPNQMMAADGGRIGYRWGRDVNDPAVEELPLIDEEEFDDIKKQLNVSPMVSADPSIWELLLKELEGTITPGELELLEQLIKERGSGNAQGGRIGAQEGGLMDMGGQEKDYRDEGGFVPIGAEERADDVPARLSKNEFVFTADAVRAAGGGDIDRGSEVMQNVMDNLEQGGEVSEDSQGLQGGEEIMSEEIIDESNPAQGMYDNYEQLQSRVG